MDKASIEQVNQHHVQTQRTARIASLGQAGPQTRNVWIVLHGYRMLATNFVRKFQTWASEDTWILAPEGLSKFYVEGFTGRVGASWMTREDRLSEIEDQKVWLDNVWEWVHERIDPENCQVHVLAFSQGVATLWRWLESTTAVPASLVFYAGKIPEEFSQKMDEKLSLSPIVFAYGTEDQFLTAPRLQRESEIVEAHMPHAETVTFTGKHDIYPEALEKIKARLKS